MRLRKKFPSRLFAAAGLADGPAYRSVREVIDLRSGLDHGSGRDPDRFRIFLTRSIRFTRLNKE